MRLFKLLLIPIISFLVVYCADDVDNSDNGSEQTEQVKEPHELQAGVARGYLNAPIGISQGGFGERSGCDGKCFKDERFCQMLFSSWAMFDRPAMRALALDVGTSEMIVVQLPIIFADDSLRKMIIDQVFELADYDVSESLIMTTTHTHSGPVRYAATIPDHFGFGGVDSSQVPMIESYRDQITDLVIEAINNKQAAKLGSAVEIDWDVDDEVYYDRRCEDDGLYAEEGWEGKDPYLGLIRVDTIDGQPLAVLINFPLHGTVFGGNDWYLSGDAPGSISLKFEEYYYQQTGEQITALYVNGTAGDIGPTGLSGQNAFQSVQGVGQKAAPKIYRVYDAIEQFNEQPDMEVNYLRDPFSHELIYPNDPNTFPFENGGFFCTTDYVSDCDNIETELTAINCIIDVKIFEEQVLHEEIVLFDHAVYTGIRLGDLYIATMPGEPQSSLGAYLRETVERDYGIAQDKLLVFGYSQDHHFYLMLDEDWYQGGYEVSMNNWGPAMGRYMADASARLIGQLTTPEIEDNENGLTYKVADFSLHPEDRLWDYFATEAGEIGEIIEDVPSTVKRLDVVTFKWMGGDNACGTPNIVLEKFSGAGFDAALGKNGLPIDESGYEIVVNYDFPFEADGPVERLEQWSNVWWIDWDVATDFATGDYRFAVTGKYYDGSDCIDYGPVYSAEFAVVESDELIVEGLAVDAIAGTVSAQLLYAANPNGILLRDLLAPSDQPNPARAGQIEVAVTLDGSAAATINLAYDEGESTFIGDLDLAGVSTYSLCVTGGAAIDPYGNVNGASAELTGP
jgi:neutral ceramidase